MIIYDKEEDEKVRFSFFTFVKSEDTTPIILLTESTKHIWIVKCRRNRRVCRPLRDQDSPSTTSQDTWRACAMLRNMTSTASEAHRLWRDPFLWSCAVRT